MSIRNNSYAFYLIILLFLIIEISVNSVQIRVENKGGYVARVLLRYQNSKGQQQSYNSGSFPTLQTSTINLEDNTKSIEIEVQMYLFINSVRTIFKIDSPCPHTRCFTVWGTIFNAGWSENCCKEENFQDVVNWINLKNNITIYLTNLPTIREDQSLFNDSD